MAESSATPKTTKTNKDTPPMTSTAPSFDTATSGSSDTSSASDSSARANFARAIEEAKAGAQALGKEAQGRADAYREKFAGAGADWADEARNFTGQARERAAALASDGKTRASDAISTLGKLVADNASTLDEKLGAKYGDYARSAARSMQETAARLESKDIAELGDDAIEFVRKSPGLAIGIAAVAGFVLSRAFTSSDD